MHDIDDLSVVIVTWNSRDEIVECLESLTGDTNLADYEISHS